MSEISEKKLFEIEFVALIIFYSLQRGSNGFITEKTVLFQGSRGGPTPSRGGSNFFPGVVQLLIPIETHITCDFFFGGGVRTPYPPMDLHMPFR